MTAFGACHPEPCDWGIQPLMVFAPNVREKLGRVGMATYRNFFSETRLIVRMSRVDTLHVQTFTHFTDGSGRSDYTQTEIMH